MAKREGLSDSFETLTNATIFAMGSEGGSGVFRADGSFCTNSRGQLGPRRFTPEPTAEQVSLPRKTLAGRHLYGGWLRPHFGHFLLETTSRLWALDQLDRKVDSVLFVPFRGKGGRRARDRYRAFIDLLTDGVPASIINKPYTVDELIVLDPGFGHGPRVLGSPAFRSFIRSRIESKIAPEGPEKIYISRTRLLDKRGGVFGEERIEALMAENGFEIYHPQQHTIPDQLAVYRAAREVVSLDGSALHLVAFAAQPGVKVGIIMRRHAPLVMGLGRHLEAFADAKVHLIDGLRGSWVDEGARRVDFRSIGEVDLPKVRDFLASAGLIETRSKITDLGRKEIEQIIAEMDRGPMKLWTDGQEGA
jgi:hypothetical protein